VGAVRLVYDTGMSERIRIGDMLVAAGFITDAQVKEALARQRTSGRRLGEELVEMGLVTEVQLTQMLSNQLSIAWVSLYHVEFSRELLDLLPAEIADEYCVIPIYVRQLRKQGDTLYVAMDDPTNEEALARIHGACSLPVKVMVAPPSEIRDAIRVYYFGESPSAPAYAASQPPRSQSIPPPAVMMPRAQSIPPPKAGAVSVGGGDAEEPGLHPRDEPPGKPPTSAKGKFVTLTLLDGTTVRLPSQGSKDAPAERGLTAHDLIAALQAKGEGKNVSGLLPDSSWETLLATLLSLLVRKGLVADWEFVDEYKKRTQAKGGAPSE
jgi:type IV pilus assembly protein PilB